MKTPEENLADAHWYTKWSIRITIANIALIATTLAIRVFLR